MRSTSILVTATAAVAAVALTAGCGSSSSSAPAAGTTTEAATTPAPSPTSTVGDTEAEPTTSPATTAPGKAVAVAVTMGKPEEFSLSAAPASATAGKVTFNVANKGTILHEMVVVPGTAASLKQPDGTASEAGSPGEVPDVEPGKSGKITIKLPAGTYTLLCNLPGHFAGGMYTQFTVKLATSAPRP